MLHFTYKFMKNTNIHNKPYVDSDNKGFAEFEHKVVGLSTS